MQRVHDDGARAAASGANVLILGEEGVGKEVMAHRLHRASARADSPMVSVNCAGLAPTCLQRQLFGYLKGAFAGATQAQPGLLEIAQNGTIFLDEIGEAPPEVVERLTAVMETNTVSRLGSHSSIPIDVWFIAATNRDPESGDVEESRRQKAYLRLFDVRLVIPPLRDRRSEIPGLTRLFVDAQDARQRESPIQPAVTAFLAERPWPGNVRELLFLVQRAAILADGAVLGLEHLSKRR